MREDIGTLKNRLDTFVGQNVEITTESNEVIVGKVVERTTTGIRAFTRKYQKCRNLR